MEGLATVRVEAEQLAKSLWEGLATVRVEAEQLAKSLWLPVRIWEQEVSLSEVESMQINKYRAAEQRWEEEDRMIASWEITNLEDYHYRKWKVELIGDVYTIAVSNK